MPTSLLQQESLIRMSFFVGVLCCMMLLEYLAPKRTQQASRWVRWSNNLALVFINSLLVRLSFPVVAVGFAIVCAERGWGLFNVFKLPDWVAFVATILIFDLAIYLQHVMFHAVPAFWRLHRMHHADTEIDVTTGLRFHPIEILLSMGIKLMLVALVGPPAVAVMAFEILLNATAMFNHSNLRLPQPLDNFLRWFLVTPDMHRVHHSVHIDETNSNFGFNLTWWDQLLGTYRAQPRDGHQDMQIGLKEFRSSRDLWLDRLLLQPLGSVNADSINEKNTPAPKKEEGHL